MIPTRIDPKGQLRAVHRARPAAHTPRRKALVRERRWRAAHALKGSRPNLEVAAVGDKSTTGLLILCIFRSKMWI